MYHMYITNFKWVNLDHSLKTLACNNYVVMNTYTHGELQTYVPSKCTS